MDERTSPEESADRGSKSARESEPVASRGIEEEREAVRAEIEDSPEPGHAKGADEDEQRFDAG